MLQLYHVLNRGVDKRKIFLDDKDYFRFMHDLFEFNDTQNVLDVGYYAHKHFQYLDVGRPDIVQKKNRKLLVHIHAFCAMPNHYHILVSPVISGGLSLFMKKLNGGYAKYFNERYKRNGALFQGKYKSVPILGDPHFSHIPYYIHFNPLDLTRENNLWRERNAQNPRAAINFLAHYRWSSHLDYFGKKNFPSITQREFLLDFFGKEKGYKKSLLPTLKSFSVNKIQENTLE